MNVLQLSRLDSVDKECQTLATRCEEVLSAASSPTYLAPLTIPTIAAGVLH